VKAFDACSDAALLAATAEDAEAFGVFYRRHRGWVLSFVARRVGEPELAADVTAEIFAAALLAAERYDETLGAPNGWLFGIASRQIGRALRRGRAEARARRRLRLERVPLEAEDVTLLEALAAGEQEATRSLLTDEALSHMPEDAAALLRSRFVFEKSYDDLADHHQISPAAARKRVSRALAVLRAQLGEDR
jgi:RNA polymerase sigma factor (sigma-70 family)